jgi:hypothetical protein
MKIALFLFIVAALSTQTETPFKAKEDFEIKLKYEFKQRVTANNSNSVNLAETVKEHERKTSTAMLPYVGLNIKLVKLATEEVRMRIIDNQNKVVYNKKVEQDDLVFLDLGFTDDMKDQITPYEYTAYFLTAGKEQFSKILIVVQQDGSFLVNNEKRGKF